MSLLEPAYGLPTLGLEEMTIKKCARATQQFLRRVYIFELGHNCFE